MFCKNNFNRKRNFDRVYETDNNLIITQRCLFIHSRKQTLICFIIISTWLSQFYANFSPLLIQHNNARMYKFTLTDLHRFNQLDISWIINRLIVWYTACENDTLGNNNNAAILFCVWRASDYSDTKSENVQWSLRVRWNLAKSAVRDLILTKIRVSLSA